MSPFYSSNAVGPRDGSSYDCRNVRWWLEQSHYFLNGLLSQQALDLLGEFSSWQAGLASNRVCLVLWAYVGNEPPEFPRESLISISARGDTGGKEPACQSRRPERCGFGSWAIVAYRYKYDGNSTGKNYRSVLVWVHQHAAMMKHAHSKQRALE